MKPSSEQMFVLTLCSRCASVYYGMKDRKIKRKDIRQAIKEPCDICCRAGYEYIIEENKGEQHEH